MGNIGIESEEVKMNKRTEIMECPNCGGKFELTEFNPDGLGWEKENYYCPHDDCNYFDTRRSPGSFKTTKHTN
ncbi:hypothetical protein PNC201_02490 [Pseudoalteromonas sp. NC201]|nr:hypothetical protein PNC201_02490 [Pseudoalteromonas sp. NC201]